MHRPAGELGERRRPNGDRHPVAGQHQFGDRLQIDHIGLHPTPTLNPTLLGHPRRTQLQHLPARRPHPSRQQRTVIMPSRLNADLTTPRSTHPQAGLLAAYQVKSRRPGSRQSAGLGRMTTMAVIGITGSTDGIALAMARVVLADGHRVLLHARRRERGTRRESTGWRRRSGGWRTGLSKSGCTACARSQKSSAIAADMAHGYSRWPSRLSAHGCTQTRSWRRLGTTQPGAARLVQSGRTASSSPTWWESSPW